MRDVKDTHIVHLDKKRQKGSNSNCNFEKKGDILSLTHRDILNEQKQTLKSFDMHYISSREKKSQFWASEFK